MRSPAVQYQRPARRAIHAGRRTDRWRKPNANWQTSERRAYGPAEVAETGLVSTERDLRATAAGAGGVRRRPADRRGRRQRDDRRRKRTTAPGPRRIAIAIRQRHSQDYDVVAAVKVLRRGVESPANGE